jgi:hypothetical protein
VNYQTIRLSAGKHSSPESGACVMELASMLAGEHFTDHPTSVCDVIASFMRAYNDAIDDKRRQDLYPYAAKVLGSRGSSRVQQARADLLNAWVSAHRRRSRLPSFLRRFRSAGRCGTLEELSINAVRAISRHDDETHAAVLALVDDLLRLGRAWPGGADQITHPLAAHRESLTSRAYTSQAISE